jgi:hypothetical protein
VRAIFVDQNDELSFTKCVSISHLAPKLGAAGLNLENIETTLGAVMRCFGCIEYEDSWGLRQPPETEDQKKARVLLQMELDKQAKQQKEDAKKENEKPMTEDELAELKIEEAKT